MVAKRLLWPLLMVSAAALAWVGSRLLTSNASTKTEIGAEENGTQAGDPDVLVPPVRSPFNRFDWPTRDEWLLKHGIADSAVSAEQTARFREYMLAPAFEKKRLRLACVADFGEDGKAIERPTQENIGCIPWKIERLIALGQASLEKESNLWSLRAKPLQKGEAPKSQSTKSSTKRRTYSWDKLIELPYEQLKREIRFESLEQAAHLVKQANLRSATCDEGVSRAALVVALEDLLPSNEAWMLMQFLYGATMECLAPSDAGYERLHQRMGLLLLERGRVQEAVVALGKSLLAQPPEDHESTLFWLGFAASLNVGSAATASQTNPFWERLERGFPLGLHNFVARTVRGDAPLASLKAQDDLVMSVYEGKIWSAYNYWAFLSVLAHAVDDQAVERELGTYLDTGVVPKEMESSLFAVFLAKNRRDYRQQVSLSMRVASNPRWRASGSELIHFLYPTPWEEIVVQNGERVDPALIWAVMRTESRFDPSVSTADGAKGLMQIRATEGDDAAKRATVDLMDVRTNIRVGSEMLESALRRYGSSGAETLVAYNAGEANLERWIKRYRRVSMLLFLDLVPFPGTRRYLKSVLSAEIIYAHLLSDKRPNLQQRSAAGILMPFLPSAEKMRLITFASLDFASALDALGKLEKIDQSSSH